MNGNNTGWVKIHRRLFDSSIWPNHNVTRFWLWALLRASHQDLNVKVGNVEVELQPGQFFYSHANASIETGLSQKVVRTCVETLGREMGIVMGREKGSKKSILTVVNWASYQNDDSGKGREKGNQKGKEMGSSIYKVDKKLKNNISAKAFAEAAARIDTLYRERVPSEHNRSFTATPSSKRIAQILKDGTTEEELTRSVMNYAKVAGNYPVGIRRFFSKQQGDMWREYLNDVPVGGGSTDDDWEISEAAAAEQLAIEKKLAQELANQGPPKTPLEIIREQMRKEAVNA